MDKITKIAKKIVVGYAVCHCCGREMEHGCDKHWYIIDGEKYEALKQGEDGNDGVCHDCNAHPGEYHHQGCDNERCPKCGGQMIGFHGCNVDDDIIFEK